MPAPSRRSPAASNASKAAGEAAVSRPSVMSVLRHALRWLRLAFVGQVRLKRRGSNFDIVMESRLHGRDSTTSRPAGAHAEPEDVKLMRRELRAVLDRHPAARSVLPHLAAVERGLRHKGLAAFADFPPGVLRKALVQLEPLCADPSATGLAALRAQLVTRTLDDQPKPEQGSPGLISDFNVSDKVELSEVGVSVFLEAEQAMARQAK